MNTTTATETLTAAALFDLLTNTGHEVRRSFVHIIVDAYNAGNNSGDGFEPDVDIVEDADRRGTAGNDLDLYVLGGRIVAVGDAGGAWAVDVTDDVRAGYEAGI